MLPPPAPRKPLPTAVAKRFCSEGLQKPGRNGDATKSHESKQPLGITGKGYGEDSRGPYSAASSSAGYSTSSSPPNAPLAALFPGALEPTVFKRPSINATKPPTDASATQKASTTIIPPALPLIPLPHIRRPTVTLSTTFGNICIVLCPHQTPRSCYNIYRLAELGYYDNTVFHRVIHGFMIQGGDPTGTGRGGRCVYAEEAERRLAQLELSETSEDASQKREGRRHIGDAVSARFFEDERHPDLRHECAGVVSLANCGAPNSNGSQFFITLAAAPHLDASHNIVGRVLRDDRRQPRVTGSTSASARRALSAAANLPKTVYRTKDAHSKDEWWKPDSARRLETLPASRQQPSHGSSDSDDDDDGIDASSGSEEAEEVGEEGWRNSGSALPGGLGTRTRDQTPLGEDDVSTSLWGACTDRGRGFKVVQRIGRVETTPTYRPKADVKVLKATAVGWWM